MAKFRLNTEHRGALCRFAKETLVCQAEADAEMEAWNKLQIVTNAMIATLAPESDMVVLRRHNAVRHEPDITVVGPPLPGSRKDQRLMTICFCPRNAAEGPFSESGESCYRRKSDRKAREMPAWFTHPRIHTKNLPEAMAEDLISAFNAYADAARKHDEARDTVISAARAAIQRSRTLEDLIEVWPVAEAIREKLGAKLLPVATSPDEYARTLQRASFVVPAPEAAQDGAA